MEKKISASVALLIISRYNPSTQNKTKFILFSYSCPFLIKNKPMKTFIGINFHLESQYAPLCFTLSISLKMATKAELP